MKRRKMVNRPGLIFDLMVIIIALIVTGFVGCSGGGTDPVDGDDEDVCECTSNDDCNECYYCSNCMCVYEIGCQVDGDNQDSDLDDTDGDANENTDTSDGDIEICEEDCSSEQSDQYVEEENNTCQKDEDCPEGYRCHLGVCYYFDDGDLDIDEDRDVVESCQCIPGDNLLCGDDEYCGDDCMCHTLEEDNSCGGAYYGECTGHSDCPRGVPCNTEIGCCDLATEIDCSSDPCPDGMFCTDFNYCDAECIPDILPCTQDGYCCSANGECRKWACLDGDSDGEEDDWSGCLYCDDCLNAPQFGEGYYCNIVSHDCELLPVGEDYDPCCKPADCTEQDYGGCNLRTGLCYYLDDPVDKGSISGSVYTNEEVFNTPWTYTVILRNSSDIELRRDSNRVIESIDGVYKFDYKFDKLQQGSYKVYLFIQKGVDDIEYANEFNPIVVEFDDIYIEKTIRENIDFYLQVEDPRLAKLEGIITIDDQLYGYDVPIIIDVYKKDFSTGNIVWSNNVSTLSDSSRTYSFPNLNNGSYFVTATLEGTIIDYYSKLININLTTYPSQLVSNVNFYFDDIVGSNLGQISGRVHYASYLSESNINVNLYDLLENMSYVRAMALKTTVDGQSFDYKIPNVEAGNFNIVSEIVYYGISHLVYPLPAQNASIDVEDGQEIIAQDRDIYIDVIQPDYCSISGTVVYYDLFDVGDFNIELYDSDAFTNMIVSDPVLNVNGDNAEFFVEGLEAGTYYLKVVRYNNESEFITYGSPISVDLSGGTKDANGIILDFTN